MLVRITASHFCAGIVVGHRAAPIIYYMINWDFNRISNYCNKKGWGIEILD